MPKIEEGVVEKSTADPKILFKNVEYPDSNNFKTDD